MTPENQQDNQTKPTRSLLSKGKLSKGNENKDVDALPIATWTASHSWLSKIATVVMWVMLISGPLALGLLLIALANRSSSTSPATTSSVSSSITDQVVASDTARNFVISWLRANKKNGGADAVNSYLATKVDFEPADSSPLFDNSLVTVASSEFDSDRQVWNVVVGVTLTDSARRYFRTSIVVDPKSHQGRAAVLPSETNFSNIGTKVTSGYDVDVKSDSPVFVMLNNFFPAYLKSKQPSDYQAYLLSPEGSGILPVPSPAYQSATIVSVSATDDPAAVQPGETLAVLVTVRAVPPVKQQASASSPATASQQAAPVYAQVMSYPLTLQRRKDGGGQWVIAHVDTSPHVTVKLGS